MSEERFWWQFSSSYWEIPFFSEFGLNAPPDRDDALAMREQLWAIREFETGETAWRKNIRTKIQQARKVK